MNRRFSTCRSLHHRRFRPRDWQDVDLLGACECANRSVAARFGLGTADSAVQLHAHLILARGQVRRRHIQRVRVVCSRGRVRQLHDPARRIRRIRPATLQSRHRVVIATPDLQHAVRRCRRFRPIPRRPEPLKRRIDGRPLRMSGDGEDGDGAGDDAGRAEHGDESSKEVETKNWQTRNANRPFARVQICDLRFSVLRFHGQPKAAQGWLRCDASCVESCPNRLSDRGARRSGS